MSDIFISYASEDRAEIEKIAHALEAQGWSVWWDRSIPVGKSFDIVIEEALDESLCVVVVWSKVSVKSRWVRAEAAEAQRQGKLFPLNIDGSKPPLVYRSLQMANFGDWSGEVTAPAFEKLAAAIRDHIGTPVSKAEAGSEIKEETTNSKSGPSQPTSTESTKVFNGKQTGGKKPVGGTVSVVANRNDIGKPVSKAETGSKLKEETTNSKIGPSQPAPTEPEKVFNVKQTGGEKPVGGNVRAESVTAPFNEQSAPSSQEQSKNNWIAPVFVVLLLSLMIGMAFWKNTKNTKNNIVEPEMVVIPKGCFQMGSPASDKDRESNEQQHEVCVDAFKMAKYEVSFEEYEQFCDVTRCEKPDDAGWGRGNRPVIIVDWNDATAYAEWLAKETGKHYRLPTEAEWEYAARGGSKSRYPWGDDIGSNNANCNGCGSQWDDKKTAPVGSFAANDFGLYDTVGNVWEWTCSRYVQDYDGSEKKCVEKGNESRRVIRGGSWSGLLRLARSAYRLWHDPYSRNYDLGFRLAQD